MSSKWQMNKIGLIDFWYYDEQEFSFLDGRMLLRGANGSGKSVTMQSFIPLLLDGNLRPERLDPFGSRARKMENYLLEEDDPREERTGYLYMEMKRRESDAYLTLGIGLRARKGKKLESWYFSITDGRRIGKDFYLYKDLGSKIVFTKRELRNRIGEGGRVMETQGEYLEYVNKQLFGFETLDEYRETLELLIQLRTPKLSKDFKPTIINEILSSSLQPLSEDDLRPMSEAIENMDSLKTNLNMLQDSLRAAAQIEKAYEPYNQMVLYNKASLYRESCRKLREETLKALELAQEMQQAREERIQAQHQYEDLKQEEEVLLKERASLADSDAARLKEQEERLLRDQKQEEEEEADKRRQEADKLTRQLETQQRIRRQKEANEASLQSLEDGLEVMEEELGEVPFDEFTFLKQELTENPQQQASFENHERMLKEYKTKVRKGLEALEEEEAKREKYERFLRELDEYREEQNQAERLLLQQEALVHEAREELTEKIYQWSAACRELELQPETLQQLSRRIGDYRMGTDYAEIRQTARPDYDRKESSLKTTWMELGQACKNAREEYRAAQEELDQWQKSQDPEPERSEAVCRNRQRLKEKGIPHQAFYQAVDFADGLPRDQAARLEEALQQMGILDALIVPAEYRERVLELDGETCDKYIFSDLSYVSQNLTDLLDVDNGEDDILYYQQITRILGGVGSKSSSWMEEGKQENSDGASTWIDSQGRYGLGILEGNVTGACQPRYIGAGAREAYRRRKIEECQLRCQELEQGLADLEAQVAALEERLAVLQEDWGAFPSDQTLKEAAKACDQAEYKLEMAQNKVSDQQVRTAKERAKLDQIRLQVQKLCALCDLTARLDVFRQATEALNAYQEALGGVRISHETYRNGLQALQVQEENLDQLEGDLDDIRYDLNRVILRLKETRQTLESVQRQLQMTDYEQIKERLDTCIRRLSSLPTEREGAVKRQTALDSQISVLQKELEDNSLAQDKLRKRQNWLERAFAEEYKLGYVELLSPGSVKGQASQEDPGQTFENLEAAAEKVCRSLNGRFGNRKQLDYQGSLQEAYHQNRGYLLEYHLTLQTLFEELDQEMDQESSAQGVAMKRIDIGVKYRGAALGFLELVQKLREDEEEQKRLLSDKDRELFEDILANTISKKIRSKIHGSQLWVSRMNKLMEAMQTSSGLRLSLNWKSRRAETEDQLDTRSLVDLLQKDVEIMREEEVDKLSRHFRSKIQEARKRSDEENSLLSFHSVMREILDYRKWFEFQLEYQKAGEKKKELTDRAFFTFSGGEKAMAMYVPLFSAVVAKYDGSRSDAPRLISLDEAFAGVDETNIRDMFRLMVEFDFNFIINSQVLWGDHDTVPALAIYQLVRPLNAKYVTVIPYVWNGQVRTLVKEGKTGQEA